MTVLAARVEDSAAVVARVSPRFARAEARDHAAAYLRGLPGPAMQKNSWQLAEAVGAAVAPSSGRPAGAHPPDSARDPLPARPPVGRRAARCRGHLALVTLARSPPGRRPLLPLPPPRPPPTTTVALSERRGSDRQRDTVPER